MTLMNCPQCQQENPTGAKFCKECGARLLFAGPAPMLTHGTRIHQYCGAIQDARDLSEALIALAHEQGSRPDWIAAHTSHQGWLMAAQGQVGEGIAKMREGLEAEQARVHAVLRPYSFMMLAGAYGEVGQLRKDCTKSMFWRVRRLHRYASTPRLTWAPLFPPPHIHGAPSGS